jgi:alpha-glucosidase
MIYMNPYFANLTGNPSIRDNYFKDLDDAGWMVKNGQNESYLIKSVSIEFGMLDFSNPEAREWAKSLIKDNLLKEGRAIGWMADFGEYAPMTGAY